MESEESFRQSSGLTNRNHIRLQLGIRLHNKSKSNNYSELIVVNVADGWSERLRSYLGRSRQRMEFCRVEIPKETKGEFRKLGVPTVVDRVFQQAIIQVLSPIYEEQFSENSFGFRPKRGAHDALKQCQQNVNDGYVYVVGMDLEKFFDTVCQSKLIEVLSKTIKDGRVISLIHKYLNAGVISRGVFEKTETGMPQGGPLSPLLSNVMLNELDRELTRRGHRFVRYADDCAPRKRVQVA